MKSKEFITEDIGTKVRAIQEEYKLKSTIVNVGLKIRNKCQPYLQQNASPVLHSPLFRGLGSRQRDADEVVKKRVRLDDRNPVDMPTVLHQYINEYFAEYYGAPFRNAMFATGSILEASGYGNEYIIFPIGDFEYLWSPKIDDLWTSFDQFTAQHGIIPAGGPDIYDRFMDNIVYNGEWKTNDLKGAIDSKHEIMIRCKEYYGIAYNDLEDGKKWRGLEAILKL